MKSQKQPVCDAREDAELKRRVVGYLATKHLANLRRLEVSTHAGTVTLRGRVDSFHEKQVALHCCQRVAGVRELVDSVDVKS